MGREDSGLALQGLAQRLEALEREKEEMEKLLWRPRRGTTSRYCPRAALSPYPETVILKKMSWAQASWMNAR